MIAASGWPAWLHAVGAVLFCLGGIGIWRLCFFLVESPAILHFFHSADPLCWRCFRTRQLREEKRRHAQMVRELRAKREVRR